MFSKATRLLPLAALAALAACDSGIPEEQAPESRADAPAPVDAEPPAPAPAEAPGNAAASDDTLPAALQGRWGLTPADCTAGPAAEGLLVIGPENLEFYESTATLQSIEQSSPTTARAHFAFTGEGMSWQREMALALDQNGAALTRREFGEDAAEGAIRYVKCPAGG